MLRTYEAAARLGSVTRAAQELHVTQSAVSHQVKLLEQWLGVKLITRSGRGLALTAAGAACLPGLSQAFDALAQAMLAAQRQAQHPRLTVNAMPTVAAQWLIPRLPSFCAALPAVDVQVLTTASTEDFDPAAFEISLRCLSLAERDRLAQRTGWRDVTITPFLAESITPVCSPAYLKRVKRLREPAEILAGTLIHSRSAPHQWRQWLALARVPNRPTGGKMVFDHAHQALQAAIQGVGIALASTEFARDALHAGLLVSPFPDLGLEDRRYFWIVHASHWLEPSVRKFCAWLVAEGAKAGTLSAGA